MLYPLSYEGGAGAKGGRKLGCFVPCQLERASVGGYSDPVPWGDVTVEVRDHAVVVATEGESFRMKEARVKRGRPRPTKD